MQLLQEGRITQVYSEVYNMTQLLGLLIQSVFTNLSSLIGKDDEAGVDVKLHSLWVQHYRNHVWLILKHLCSQFFFYLTLNRPIWRNGCSTWAWINLICLLLPCAVENYFCCARNVRWCLELLLTWKCRMENERYIILLLPQWEKKLVCLLIVHHNDDTQASDIVGKTHCCSCGSTRL